MRPLVGTARRCVSGRRDVCASTDRGLTREEEGAALESPAYGQPSSTLRRVDGGRRDCAPVPAVDRLLREDGGRGLVWSWVCSSVWSWVGPGSGGARLVLGRSWVWPRVWSWVTRRATRTRACKRQRALKEITRARGLAQQQQPAPGCARSKVLDMHKRTRPRRPRRRRAPGARGARPRGIRRAETRRGCAPCRRSGGGRRQAGGAGRVGRMRVGVSDQVPRASVRDRRRRRCSSPPCARGARAPRAL